MEVEPRIAKLYKMAQQLLWEELQRNDARWSMEKGVCVVFHMIGRSRVCGRNEMCILQHEQVIACCHTHYDYGPSKMYLKLTL